jgi:alkylation response protein AidB-like acyl-CoA dehydrogenase
MDFSLSEEQKMMLDVTRRFVERELMPLEGQMQEAELAGRYFPDPDLLRELQLKGRQAGLWGLMTPEAYGGAEVGYLMTALILMETARTFIPFQYGGQADNILYHGNEAQQERYLLPTIEGERKSCFAITEPGAGSDARNIRMTARKVGGDWLLNGEKVFITGGNEADFAIVFAVTNPERPPRASEGITAFLVDRDMGWRSSPIPTMGGWSPASLSFEDVRVPQENVLGEEGRGFYLAMEWIGSGRIFIPARAVGQGQRLIEMGLQYSQTRETFGQPIADYQAIQWMLADSATELEQVKWLVLRAAWVADQGRDYRHAASMAKLSGAQMIWNVADRMLQLHGGMGYTKEMPIERVLRDVRVYRIYEGTDEIQRRSIARNLLRGFAKVNAWD